MGARASLSTPCVSWGVLLWTDFHTVALAGQPTGVWTREVCLKHRFCIHSTGKNGFVCCGTAPGREIKCGKGEKKKRDRTGEWWAAFRNSRAWSQFWRCCSTEQHFEGWGQKSLDNKLSHEVFGNLCVWSQLEMLWEHLFSGYFVTPNFRRKVGKHTSESFRKWSGKLNLQQKENAAAFVLFKPVHPMLRRRSSESYRNKSWRKLSRPWGHLINLLAPSELFLLACCLVFCQSSFKQPRQ